MSDVTRLLNDYATRIAALPERAGISASDERIEPSSRAEYALEFVAIFTRLIAEEMRAVADLYRTHESNAATPATNLPNQ